MIDRILDNLPYIINQVETIGFVLFLLGVAIIFVAAMIVIWKSWGEETDND